jgi:hypothetical protein
MKTDIRQAFDAYDNNAQGRGWFPKLSLTFAALVLAGQAWAHTAPASYTHPEGWKYSYQCCHERDCRRIAYDAIDEGPNGYVIKATGEVIPYTDMRVKMSEDQYFHWCSQSGLPDSKTICLYVPSRGS